MSTEEDIWCVTLRKKVERKSNQHLFLRDKKNQKEEQNQKKKPKKKNTAFRFAKPVSKTDY